VNFGILSIEYISDVTLKYNRDHKSLVQHADLCHSFNCQLQKEAAFSTVYSKL